MCMFSTTENKTTNDDQTVIIFRLFSAFLALSMIFSCDSRRFPNAVRSENWMLRHQNAEIPSSFWSWNRLQVQTFNRFSFSAMNQHRSLALTCWNAKKSKHVIDFRCRHLKLIDRCYQFWLWFPWIWIGINQAGKEMPSALFKYLWSFKSLDHGIKNTHRSFFRFLKHRHEKNSSKCFVAFSAVCCIFSSVPWNRIAFVVVSDSRSKKVQIKFGSLIHLSSCAIALISLEFSPNSISAAIASVSGFSH